MPKQESRPPSSGPKEASRCSSSASRVYCEVQHVGSGCCPYCRSLGRGVRGATMPNADQRHCIERVRPMKLLVGQNRFARVGEGHITLCRLWVTDFSRVGAGWRMAGAGLTTNSWHHPIYGFFLLRRPGGKWRAGPCNRRSCNLAGGEVEDGMSLEVNKLGKRHETWIANCQANKEGR
jgi:hypothetical protein